ncbi:MAG: hypothetical protein LBV04_08340, partial [Deferribacteraceae bacterium]|nr:hypothetical protein [Deferribacteraceae bacterium]
MKRELKPSFIAALLSGELAPLLAKVKSDSTLMLAIRENYINIYYLGGNAIKLDQYAKENGFNASTGDYVKDGSLEKCPFSDAAALDEWFEKLKPAMKQSIEAHNKTERKIQQEIVKANFAIDQDYIIADIEVKVGDKEFDMLALKRLPNGKFQLSVIELKYGEGAFGNYKGSVKAGIVNHLQDFHAAFSQIEEAKSMAISQLNTYIELGLLPAHKYSEVDIESKVEFLFLLLNYDPQDSKSSVLHSILTKANAFEADERSKYEYDLRYFASKS